MQNLRKVTADVAKIRSVVFTVMNQRMEDFRTQTIF